MLRPVTRTVSALSAVRSTRKLASHSRCAVPLSSLLRCRPFCSSVATEPSTQFPRDVVEQFLVEHQHDLSAHLSGDGHSSVVRAIMKSHYSSLSKKKLTAVCSEWGIKGSNQNSKDELLSEIERALSEAIEISSETGINQRLQQLLHAFKGQSPSSLESTMDPSSSSMSGKDGISGIPDFDAVSKSLRGEGGSSSSNGGIEWDSSMMADASRIAAKANRLPLEFDRAHFADSADGAVLCRSGGSIVMATAVCRLPDSLIEDSSVSPRELGDLDLRVESREKAFARGFIPGSFQRSEGGITDNEVLISRMVDRCIRPMLANTLSARFTEIQLCTTLLSDQGEYDTPVLAINGACAAVLAAGVPLAQPIAAVRIASVGGRLVLNPTKHELKESPLNLLFVGTADGKCVMLESECLEIDDEVYKQALELAVSKQGVPMVIRDMIRSLFGDERTFELRTMMDAHLKNDLLKIEDWYDEAKSILSEPLNLIEEAFIRVFSDYDCSKLQRDEYLSQIRKNGLNELKESLKEYYIAQETDDSQSLASSLETTTTEGESSLSSSTIRTSKKRLLESDWSKPNNIDDLDNHQKNANDQIPHWILSDLMYKLEKQTLRSLMLDKKNEGLRCDGRRLSDLRPIKVETNVLPSTHGSAVFSRGTTRSVATTTLGPPKLTRLRAYAQHPRDQDVRRLFFTYDMPPYSTHEIKQFQTNNRRSIGHGALACKAILPVMPSFEEFPYAVRVYSSITSSNGSSSMASVCGGCLSLMDAGVPLTSPVAGISIGLLKKPDGKAMKRDSYALITDIAGIEDHCGDMDFKVAGSRSGITAVQMDMKLPGVPLSVFLDAVDRAKQVRCDIIDKMTDERNGGLIESRPYLKANAPRVEVLTFERREIPTIIGGGGHTMKTIMAESGCDISILHESSQVELCAPDLLSLEMGKKMILECLHKNLNVGDLITCEIRDVQKFGVMVCTPDGTEHLVHKSHWNLSPSVDETQSSDLCKPGEKVTLMCIGYFGPDRPHLSRKAAMWKDSTDPDERGRLALMMQSLRAPMRSRSMMGGGIGGGGLSSVGHLNESGMMIEEIASSPGINLNGNGESMMNAEEMSDNEWLLKGFSFDDDHNSTEMKNKVDESGSSDSDSDSDLEDSAGIKGVRERANISADEMFDFTGVDYGKFEDSPKSSNNRSVALEDSHHQSSKSTILEEPKPSLEALNIDEEGRKNRRKQSVFQFPWSQDASFSASFPSSQSSSRLGTHSGPSAIPGMSLSHESNENGNHQSSLSERRGVNRKLKKPERNVDVSTKRLESVLDLFDEKKEQTRKTDLFSHQNQSVNKEKKKSNTDGIDFMDSLNLLRDINQTTSEFESALSEQNDDHETDIAQVLTSESDSNEDRQRPKLPWE